MITKENFDKILNILGFSHDESKRVYTKQFSSGCSVFVDFNTEVFGYPETLNIQSDGERNFKKTSDGKEHNERFVVFECVCRLLEIGYKPEHIFLEKTWGLGHSAKSGRADITVYDSKGEKVLCIIECKTAGTEFNSAKRSLFSTQDPDKQLFSYFKQASSTQWICLYASNLDLDTNEVIRDEIDIKTADDENVMVLAAKDDSILLYKNASEVQDLYQVWEETYNKRYYKDLITGNDVTAYKIGVKPKRKKDLKELKLEMGVSGQFMEILRHNSISDKENAFNKLLSLFICKLVDERIHNDEDVVDFQYKEGTDNYFTLYERLLFLFHKGMQDFLKEDVFYIEDNYIPATLRQYTGKNRNYLEKVLIETFKKTKLLSCQVFAFKEVYNEELFLQNGKILVEMVELFQDCKLSYSTKQPFLGQLFEDLLGQGFKQDEGQFFTPIPLTNFIWNAIPYEKFINFETIDCPKVLDFACGAGHFLTEGISAISDAFEDRGFTGDNKVPDETISNWFYGIDKDNRLGRVSKIALLLNGASSANIKVADGLEHDENFLGKFFSFDILVANPPYAVDNFIEHTDKKIVRSSDVMKLMSSECDNIECAFVERMTTVLSDGGIVAIILPQSILVNRDSVSNKTREIILSQFVVKGLFLLGKSTFNKTGKETFILFAEKRNSPEHYNGLISDSLDAIFKCEDLKDWEDNILLQKYLEVINIDMISYYNFISMKMNKEEILDSDYFSHYFIDYTNNMIEDSEVENDFFDHVISIEREKIKYFAISYTCKTILVNSPKDNALQKKFLGYTFENRNRTTKIKLTDGLLYNPDDRYDQSKLAYIIKQTFEDTYKVPQELDEYAEVVNLSNLMTFDEPTFCNAIEIKSFKIKSVHRLIKMSDKNRFQLNIGDRILSSEILPAGKIPVYSANVREVFGMIDKESTKINKNYISILWGIDGDWITNLIEKNTDFYPTDHCGVLNVLDEDLDPYYVYYVLEILGLKTGFSRSNRASRERLMKLAVPLAPDSVQKTVVSECKAIEKKFNQTRMARSDYQNKILSVLKKHKILELED